jgi:Fic family protein
MNKESTEYIQLEYGITRKQHELLIALHESNAIEQEWDWYSLNDSIIAWNTLIEHNPLLSHEAVLKCHAQLMLTRATIPTSLKGVYRNCNIYIADRQGTAPTQILEQMTQWIHKQNTLVLEAVTEASQWKGNRASFEKKWSKIFLDEHIAYEIIHPFADGNGRTGRMFLNWSRVHIGLPIMVIWEETKMTKYYPIFKGK